MKNVSGLLTVLASVLILSACGQPGDFMVGLGPSAPAPVLVPGPGPMLPPVVVPGPPAPASVQTIVDSYNQWRNDNGQESIIPGLACTLYTVPQTTTQIAGTLLTTAAGAADIGSFQYNGAFNVANLPVTAGFPILPLTLQSVYQTWFIVKCTGDIVIPTSGWAEFDTNSDDGSNLYIDGVLVVNNDGLHAAQFASGTRNLEANVHSFELDFFQGGGQQELIVNMNETLLPAANLYH